MYRCDSCSPGSRLVVVPAPVVQGDGRYDYIYLRPTNGRAEDQIRRNTPPNTVRTRILTSPDHGRRLPKSMSRTLTWSQVSGPGTRLRWKAVKRDSTCTARSNPALSSTI